MKENNHSINRNFGKIFVIISFFCLFLVGFSSAKTIEISTCSDFQNIQNDLTADYVLTNDIDCSSGFSPILKIFVGSLDGQGYTIDFGGKKLNASVFQNVNDLSISNLNVINLIVSSNRNYIGGLVGDHTGGTSYINGKTYTGGIYLRNVHVQGNVSGKVQVGGLAGRIFPGEITNCSFVGNVNSSGSYLGGLVGVMLGNVSNSFFIGKASSNDSFVGGLVGHFPNYGSVFNSYSISEVKGYSIVGGLIGGASRGVIFNSYSVGNILGTARNSNANYIGGLTGYSVDLDILNSYFAGNITTRGRYVGGLAGQAHNISNSSFIGNLNLNPDNGNSNSIFGVFSGYIVPKFDYNLNSLVNGSIDNSYWLNTSNNTVVSNKDFNLPNDSVLNSFPVFDYSSFIYTNWDFENVWDDSNNGNYYPTLRAFSIANVSLIANISNITVNSTEEENGNFTETLPETSFNSSNVTNSSILNETIVNNSILENASSENPIEQENESANSSQDTESSDNPASSCNLGYIENEMYCDEDGNMIEQKDPDSFCENNFECKSNICIDSSCVDITLWNRFLSWIKALLN